MSKKTILCIGLALLPLLGFAADGGQEAMPFVRIDRDPVSSALAGAGVADASNTTYAAFSNPSLVSFAEKSSFGASWQKWSPEGTASTNLNAGAALKLGPSAGLSLGFARDVYSITVGSGKKENHPSNMMGCLGFSFKFSDKIGAGITGKYASQTFAKDVSLSAIAGDAFVFFKPSDVLNLTAGLSSVGGKVVSGKKEYSLPTSVTAGATWSDTFGRSSVKVSVDGDYFLSGGYAFAAGLEYGFAGIAFARTGYCLAGGGSVIPSVLSAGAGVKLGGFRIDCSYLTAHDALSGTLALGVGFSF